MVVLDFDTCWWRIKDVDDDNDNSDNHDSNDDEN